MTTCIGSIRRTKSVRRQLWFSCSIVPLVDTDGEILERAPAHHDRPTNERTTGRTLGVCPDQNYREYADDAPRDHYADYFCRTKLFCCSKRYLEYDPDGCLPNHANHHDRLCFTLGACKDERYRAYKSSPALVSLPHLCTSRSLRSFVFVPHTTTTRQRSRVRPL